MKSFLILTTLLVGSLKIFSQPVVYFDFVTHNEETGIWNNQNYYSTNRAKLITLADYFQANGITWNMQSDWVFLTKVLTGDSAFVGMTSNKNILRWMHEDKGVEMDPHGHESQYIYPDLVKLMDSLGLPESKLMGGTLYNQSNGINNWMNLINGQYGVIFPNFFWQPDYMMGGGTPNHVNDLNYYGFWNPLDTANYLTHYPANRLRHIGVGCEMKIWDTTTVSVITADLKEVVNKVQSGQYPANGFYLQTIFFEQGDLNNAAFYDKVIEVADSVNAIVATGVAQWKTLKQAYSLWDTVYNAQMFQWECGDIISGIYGPAGEKKINIYPNPFSSSAILHVSDDAAAAFELTIFNEYGKEVRKQAIGNNNTEISKDDLPGGIYFYLLKENSLFISSGKIIIQ